MIVAAAEQISPDSKMKRSVRPKHYAKSAEPPSGRSEKSMKLTREQSTLFPLLESRSKSKTVFREWLEAVDKHGPLMTPTMAAVALALSRQRVHMLINENRIATVQVGDDRLVPLAALERFMSKERPNGRPPGVRRELNAPNDRRAEPAGK